VVLFPARAPRPNSKVTQETLTKGSHQGIPWKSGGYDLMARPNPEKKLELETPAQQLWDAQAELEALRERLAVSFDLVAALLIRHVSTHR
jgi:hypothetical protein